MSRKPLPLLFVLALLAQACAGGASDPDQVPAAAATEGEQTVAEGATPGDSGTATGNKKKKARKGSAENQRGVGGGDPQSPGSHEPSAAAGGSSKAAAASPIPPDTYQYATDGTVTVSGSTRDMPSNTTLEVRSPTGAEQTSVRDLRDGDGNGQVIETRLSYRADGVRLAYVKVTSSFSGGLTDVREFRLDPPEMIAPAGVKPGYTNSFRMSGSGTEADVTVEALRREKVTIGGQKTNALVARVTIIFSGAIEGHQVATNWFRPADLLPLKEKVNSDVRNGPIRFRSSYDATVRAS